MSVLAADARLDADGIVRARPLPRDPRPAARLNRWPLAARLYEPLWRGRSLALLTLGAFGTRRELARVTRPGGRVWLMAAVRATSWPGGIAQVALRVGGIATPDAATLLDEAEGAGLRTLRAEHRPPVLLAMLERSPL